MEQLTCTVIVSPSSHVFLRSLAHFIVPCNGHITSCLWGSGEGKARKRWGDRPVLLPHWACMSCPVQVSSSPPWRGNCCAKTGKGEKKQKQKRWGATYTRRV